MLYEDIFERLEQEGVRYVVIGSFALALRGHDRRAADLDIVVDGAGDGPRRATRALGGAGFVPTVPLALGAVTVLRMFDAGRREVDVFVRSHVPFAELWSGSERVRVGRTYARVASVADIIRAKRLTGRPADIREADQLLAAEAARRRARSARPASESESRR
ncbi:MAG TPA: hypothetical protein VER08_12015 [Pyrinomonadaceae bacterium]|nr:hypothetical protein [Pyrinomonadaceae bacterium]